MSNSIARVLVFTLSVMMACLGHAETVRDLYTATVPVAGQDSASLPSASRTAMAEVLVKVSGSTGVTNYPEVKAALGEARTHVQQYSYARDSSAESGLAARFLFDNSYITGLVTGASTVTEPPLSVIGNGLVLLTSVEMPSVPICNLTRWTFTPPASSSVAIMSPSSVPSGK